MVATELLVAAPLVATVPGLAVVLRPILTRRVITVQHLASVL